METLYVVNVPNKEYLPFINDLVRMMTIQIMIQFLFFLNSPEAGASFFTADFFLLLIYVALGVCVYWLVIKKLVLFK